MLKFFKKLLNHKSVLIKINDNICDRKIAEEQGGNYCQD